MERVCLLSLTLGLAGHNIGLKTEKRFVPPTPFCFGRFALPAYQSGNEIYFTNHAASIGHTGRKREVFTTSST